MTIKEIQSLFENYMLLNPDFDESLLGKDEDGYTDSNIDSMYNCFEAGFELGEALRQTEVNKLQKRIYGALGLLKGTSIGEVYKAMRVLRGEQADASE
jgi:hypothetical protein